MCILNEEYQLVNPTTQVALFSVCLDNCPSIQNISWNIYRGTRTATSNTTQWTLIRSVIRYPNIWFFGESNHRRSIWISRFYPGTNTSNFTATKHLFLSNPQVLYWRFAVVYSFLTETSVSALNFVVNQPPVNGTCSVSPLNGTTSTLFKVSCPNWIDADSIKDYFLFGESGFGEHSTLFNNAVVMFLGWTQNQAQPIMIAFSVLPNFSVRLPASTDNTSLLMLGMSIRDTFDCAVELNLSSVMVVADTTEIDRFISAINTSSNGSTSSLLVRVLGSGNQNAISQVTTLLAQRFNDINTENFAFALQGKNLTIYSRWWSQWCPFKVAFLQQILPSLPWAVQLNRR